MRDPITVRVVRTADPATTGIISLTWNIGTLQSWNREQEHSPAVWSVRTLWRKLSTPRVQLMSFSDDNNPDISYIDL